ncbi:MAG: AAA family ATPase [Clostridia bacterium]|nr:AAA family ATPase [Clostridia bacterium]
MKLLKYQVENFRSVENSGWIDCDDVTTLVGINESGKSNLLLALWKLNPARKGAIDILHDLPVSKLSTLRKDAGNVKFISAEFMLGEESAKTIAESTGANCNSETIVRVSRYYDGLYLVEYPEECPESNSDVPEGEEFDKDAYEKNLKDAILEELPKFVYYSNYGNLSTKIYLPNVIKWLNGETVSGIEVNEDQVRTLRVLFDFVKLDPKEILELGKDPKIVAMERNNNRTTTPTAAEITKAENDKEERSILLQSASVELTKQFRDWWKQGEYKFRFDADGDYFRIWVSDSIRTDEVGLELRSTGLQWFISFYLIFLVESQENHKNAILLLDEAGLTLHPLAQKDLSRFFDNLSVNNQIINTTHSPFIIDTTNIERCRVVYMDENGFTVASSDLRQGADSLNDKSIYAVHAAMGLSVSDILLQGCQNIIVEGPSDQHYLNAIKSFLIKEKLLAPKQEMVFVPSGGVKGVPGVVSILSGKTGNLPYVLVDSDTSGQDTVKKLSSGLYKDQKDRIIQVKDITSIDNSEVEDIIPYSLLSRGIDRLFLTVEDETFENAYDSTLPLLPQIEAFAKKHSIEPKQGWKVELAKSVKQLLKNKKITDIDEITKTKWVNLFKKFEK